MMQKMPRKRDIGENYVRKSQERLAEASGFYCSGSDLPSAQLFIKLFYSAASDIRLQCYFLQISGDRPGDPAASDRILYPAL
jgi:hypothetical protein